MDLQNVQVNKTSCQMKSLKNQYSTVNSSMVTLYSKEKSPYNYHARALQESNFIFQQGKSCMSKTITIFKYRKRHKPYVFKGDSSVLCKTKNPEIMRKYSIPILRDILCFTTLNSKTKSSDDIISRKSNSFKRNYKFNEINGTEHSYYFRNSFFKPSFKIYRCQFNTQEETCCCSCNSDAMFEVMKSLYDCYKKKNCDHCNCILCGHLPREERRLAELRKSDVGMMELSKKQIKERRKTKVKKNKDVSSHLKGKSAADNVKIPEDLVASGVHLPEVRTKSEKELKKKVKARRLSEEGNVPEAEAIISMKKKPSGKLRKAKEAGLLTPLEGKTAKQKENILRGFAMNGIPLPIGKTASDKKLIDKVIEEMGLPPQPKTSAAEARYQKAIKAGLVTPLEGKSKPEKEKNLKDLAELGVELPVGRTSSEKSLIKKIKQSEKKRIKSREKAGDSPTLPPDKRKKLDTKTLKVMKEGKSPSDECICGLLTPEEERISRVSKISPPLKKTIMKDEIAKPSNLLHEITPSQKEKILRNIAKQGFPLPEPKTPSDKAIIEKVRQDLGMPPQTKTLEIKKPLAEKTPSQKEQLLKKMHDGGKGRTSSEKALITKVTKEPYEGKVPSETLREAKAKGHISPLDGKTPAQKEKKLRGLAKSGLPLPEGKTPSEKALIQKIQTEESIVPTRPSTPTRPPFPPDKLKKLNKSTAKGMKESKGPSDECICNLLMPESKREKLISQTPSHKKLSKTIISSEKNRKVKSAGLLTPLKGKTPEQKEKILKRLALQKIPLPEPKTASEKEIIDKVRASVGLPPEPKTSSEKIKYKKAITAGLITPLQGKSETQKEKILRGQKEIGLKLPEPRTPSEKALIQKIQETVPSLKYVLSEKIRKSKAPELVTLQGKTPEQKEKILKGLALKGIPLPEAKTSSEKKIMNKVRADVGLPPIPKTSSIKEKYDKAKAKGLITPLHGKSAAQKEKVLRGLAQMGLPLPEGRTASEKALIAKIKVTPAVEVPKYSKSFEKIAPNKLSKLDKKTAKVMKEGKGPSDECICGILTKKEPMGSSIAPKETKLLKAPSKKIRKTKSKTTAGLLTPLEVEPISEKNKIKTKLKRVGTSGVRRSVRRVGLTKSKGGIVEEFQDIIKTATCDRGCGCDKKKIRFKHSYVKIRVTSPDISSLCPCPEECVPGVKGGVFTDNKGIKVTVGRVMCLSSNSLRRLYQHEYSSSLNFVPINILLNDRNTNGNELNNISKSETEIYLKERFKQNQRFSNGFFPNKFNGKVNKPDTSNLFFKSEEFSSSLHYDYSSNISSSFDSIYFLKTNSSLSLITIPSMWSFSTTSISTNSSLDRQSFIKYDTNTYENLTSLVLEDTHRKISNISLDLCKYSSDIKKELLEFPMYRENNLDNDIQIYRGGHDNKEILLDNQNHDNYVDYVDEISNKNEIVKVFSRTLSKTQFKNSSSIIIIVASSSDCSSTSDNNSTICLEISEDRPNWNPGTSGLHHVHQKQKGFKKTKRKNLGHDIKTDSSHIRVLPNTHKVNKTHTTQFNQEYNGYQPGSHCNKLKIINTDTTEDRPCFCNVIIAKNIENNKTPQHIDNIVSEFVKPMTQGLYHDHYILDLPPVNSIQPSYLTIHQSNSCKTKPICLCKIPSCSGYQSCHADKSPNTNTLPQPNNFRNPNLYKSCDCTPTKLKEIFEKNTIQLISKACGDSKEELREKHVKLGYELNRTPYVITTQDNKCNAYNSSKLNLQSCISSDKNKKHLCPCEQHHKISNLNNYSKEFHYKTEDSNLKNKWCKDQTRQKNKKNIICKCPKEPEPENEIDENEWLDETQLRKIQSDLTQTTSGFKIKIQKKTSGLGLSFEEVLRYFAEKIENDKINEEICGCNGKSEKAKHAKCECPYEPYDIQSIEDQPPIIKETFTGIKFHIDGKGTASKGLSRILCFE